MDGFGNVCCLHWPQQIPEVADTTGHVHWLKFPRSELGEGIDIDIAISHTRCSSNVPPITARSEKSEDCLKDWLLAPTGAVRQPPMKVRVLLWRDFITITSSTPTTTEFQIYRTGGSALTRGQEPHVRLIILSSCLLSWLTLIRLPAMCSKALFWCRSHNPLESIYLTHENSLTNEKNKWVNLDSGNSNLDHISGISKFSPFSFIYEARNRPSFSALLPFCTG